MDPSARLDVAEELAFPALDARALLRRGALPAAVAAILAGFIVAGGGPADAFADALSRALDADPRWVAAAAAFELLSFTGYVALLWLVGSRVNARLGLRESAQITLGGAAATRLLPTAGVGGAALTLWALGRSGLGRRGAARTLFAFLVLLYAVFLAAIAASGALLAARGEGPLAVAAGASIAAVAAMGAALLIAVRAPVADEGGKLRTAAGLLAGGMRDARDHLRALDARLLGAVAWWGFDAAVLVAMVHTFGGGVPIAVVVLCYFLGQVGNTIPLPGAVAGGMIGVLVAFGAPADLALVSVLSYRAIAIWLPAPIGLAALHGLRGTLAAWKAEDEPAPASARVIRPARPMPVPAPLAA